MINDSLRVSKNIVRLVAQSCSTTKRSLAASLELQRFQALFSKLFHGVGAYFEPFSDGILSQIVIIGIMTKIIFKALYIRRNTFVT